MFMRKKLRTSALINKKNFFFCDTLLKILSSCSIQIKPFQFGYWENIKISSKGQGRRVHWAVYYTSPQNFKIRFFSIPIGTLLYFDLLVPQAKYPNVSTTNCILADGVILCNMWDVHRFVGHCLSRL